MNTKKAVIGWGPIMYIVLGLFVIGVAVMIFPGIIEYVKQTIFNQDPMKDFEGYEGFKPYDEDSALSEDDKIVRASMTGLIYALNALAKGENLDAYSDNKIKAEDNNIKSYTISFSGSIEIEENGFNDYRDWIFSRTFNLEDSEEINKQSYDEVWTNYNFGSCTNSNDNGWVNCDNPSQSGSEGNCYCNDEDDGADNAYDELKDLGVSSRIIDAAKQNNLAPIRDIDTVYNIELKVEYDDGTPACIVRTTTKNFLTERGEKDLLTWGAGTVTSCPDNPIFRQGYGCDRDGDGIQGYYGDKFHGWAWKDVITQTNKNNIQEKIAHVSEEEKEQYFSEGKIKASSDNGEGCLDSPTWISCPGIQIYYCGSYGYKSNTAGEENYYFHFDNNNKLQSNAGIKVKRIIDKTEIKQKKSSNLREDSSSINILGLRGYPIGAWEYAKDYDLDLLALNPLIAPGRALKKELEDPTIYCYEALTINDSDTQVKCDADTQSCSVCNFILPQDISNQGALGWFKGYGDPKYVMYYEAFPAGEEEAWIIDPADISLTSIFIWNLGARAIPIGGTAIKKIGKLTNAILKRVPVIKWPYKVLAFIGENTAALGKKTGDYLKSGIHATTKRISPEIYIKMFSRSDDLLKYTKKADLDEISHSATLVADHMFKSSGTELSSLGFSKGRKGIEEAYDMIHKGDFVSKIMSENPGITREVAESLEYITVTKFTLLDTQVLDAATVFKRAFNPINNPKIAQKGLGYALAYSAALSMAYEDSVNQKFMPIGVNELGLREPFKGTFVTGKQLPDTDDTLKQYNIQLKKDQFKGGVVRNIVNPDQQDTRFYLASPCKADLAVIKTTKKCWELDIKKENDEGETIKVSLDVPKGSVSETFGDTTFDPSTIDRTKGYTEERYENAVKECLTPNIFQSFNLRTTPVHNTPTMVVNPIPKGKVWEEGNFCYGGSHMIENYAKWGVLVGSIGLSLTTEAVARTAQTGAAVTIVGIPAIAIIEGMKLGVDIGIDFGAAVLANWIVSGTKWPNH